MTMELLTRKDALSIGAKYYFTGKPCKHGHIANRFVSTRTCTECQAMHGKQWNADNPEQAKKFSRDYHRKARQLDPQKYRDRDKARSGRHQTPEYRAQAKAYYQRTKAERCAYRREWTKQDRLRNPSNAIAADLRSLVGTAIKKQFGEKAHKTNELIGCTIEQLMDHLESLFLEGMTWENKGRNGWHVDHIRPCDSFDLTDPDQQKQCFHFSNLQPLWEADNIRKSNKWEPEAA